MKEVLHRYKSCVADKLRTAKWTSNLWKTVFIVSLLYTFNIDLSDFGTPEVLVLSPQILNWLQKVHCEVNGGIDIK